MDMTGGGALLKGALVGGFKLRHLSKVRKAYNETENWNQMRRHLQKSGVIRVNAMPRNGGWITTDHIWIKQGYGWPHKWTNHPMNLQPGVPLRRNSEFEWMGAFERTLHYPGWAKLAGGGFVSASVGALVDGGTKCQCQQ